MKPTVLSNYYKDIKVYKSFTTEKYKINLYAISCIKKDTKKKTVLKYYISNQDIVDTITKNKTSAFRVFDSEVNSGINVGFLDYITYGNKSYISDTLIGNSKELVGWGIDMEDLARDIFNAVVADEMNYQEAVRDFTQYNLSLTLDMITNIDEITYAMTKKYQWIKDDMVKGIIETVLSNTRIEFSLPYNKLEFKNNINHETIKEAFDFIIEVAESYRDEFLNREKDIKEEAKKIESDECKALYDNLDGSDLFENETSDDLLKEFSNAIEKHEIKMDISKLPEFVTKMERGLGDKIRQRKPEFPWEFIFTRYMQEACTLQYIINGKRLLLKDAQKINQERPGTFNLGDELLALFFLRNINQRDATYEHIINKGHINEQRYLYPFISGEDYQGLVERDAYNSILCNNIVCLYPGLTPDKVTNEHVKKIVDYCANIIGEGR